jgi:hypothetical protein
VNLPFRSRIRSLNLLARSPRSISRLRACWAGGPGSGRVGGDAEDVHGPGLDLHHEQDIQAPQQHGIDVQEVAGDVPVHVRSIAGLLEVKAVPSIQPGPGNPLALRSVMFACGRAYLGC